VHSIATGAPFEMTFPLARGRWPLPLVFFDPRISPQGCHGPACSAGVLSIQTSGGCVEFERESKDLNSDLEQRACGNAPSSSKPQTRGTGSLPCQIPRSARTAAQWMNFRKALLEDPRAQLPEEGQRYHKTIPRRRAADGHALVMIC